MGWLLRLFGIGGGTNVIKETVEVFRPNAENTAQRASDADSAVLGQYASEFNTRRNRGWFDQLVDGLNRLPRPLMVFSIFGLLVYTPFDPLKMTEVFTAWALIPEGIWAMAIVIVGFFFGGRMQMTGHDFRSQMASAAESAPAIIESIKAIRAMRSDSPSIASDDTDLSSGSGDNNAVDDWRSSG